MTIQPEFAELVAAAKEQCRSRSAATGHLGLVLEARENAVDLWIELANVGTICCE
jgi:hypothetical protein